MTTPKERPILFSGSMIRALLDGSKTQTRRIAKLGTDSCGDPIHPPDPRLACPYGQPGDRLWVRETWMPYDSMHNEWDVENGILISAAEYAVAYQADDHDGKEGGVTWHTVPVGQRAWPTNGTKWKPSIHMPRWASRITLEITAVRVERLQEIDWLDAKREGVRLEDCQIGPAPDHIIDYQGGYRRLWESINGPDSWDANPFVWVIEFRRLTP